MKAKRAAEILLEINAVALKPSEPFRYTSGLLSPIYTDNRLLMGYPEKRSEIIDGMIDLLKEKGIEFDVVAGTATAAIPHAAWLAEKTGKPMVYVRSKEKDHGKENKIEGFIKEGWKAIVVEDLISRGGSSVNTVQGLRAAGVEVNEIITIFTYNMNASVEKFSAEKVSLYALTNFKTLIETAVEKGYINEKEKDVALDWNKDPAGWGKKNGFE